MADISFFSAEVKEVIYQDKLPNAIYGIRVRAVDNTAKSPDEIDDGTMQVAIPLNYNFVRIPIVGEIVLCLRAPGSYATGIKQSTTLYYLDIVSLQSSVHHNGLPTISSKKIQKQTSDSSTYEESSTGNTNTENPASIDPNFTEISTAKPLQHYVGDVIMEGRYGQSIRFSTTPKSGDFTVVPKFSGVSGNPITIFRNTTQGIDTKRINDFVTETFTNEENVLVLASGQNLEFEQASKVLSSAQSKGITSWQDENWGTTPQALLSSGRIVFNSTQKEIIGFAKNGIALSSETVLTLDAKDNVSINAAKIELGTDADEPLILGNKFKSWAEGLIDDLGKLTVITPTGPSSPLASSPQWPVIAAYKSKIPGILSDIAFTVKTSNATGGSSKFNDVPTPNFVLTPEQVEEKKQEKAAVEEKLTETELNEDEKNALKDKANRAEHEIVTTEAVSGPVPVALDNSDISDNASEVTSAVQIGERKPEDEVPGEDAQLEGEQTPPLSEEENESLNSPNSGDISGWAQDWEEDDAPEDPEVEFEFIDTPYTPPSRDSFASPAPLVIPQNILDFGTQIAILANQDVTDLLKEDPIDSYGLGSPRIETMLANVNCRPGNAPWHAAAVATWFKDAGVPIPTEGASTVQGWLKWGRDTNRYLATPIVGSAVIIGTTESDPNDTSKKIETATDIGVVVQVVDNERVIACQVVKGELKLVEVNISATLGFILPSDKDLEAPITPKSTGNGETSIKPGYVIVKDSRGREHVVFQQYNGTGGSPEKDVPWLKLVYGTAGQSTIKGGGCGVCSTSAVIRNLTKNPEVDPYMMGLRFGGHDYGPVDNPKKYPKDMKNYHASGPGGGNGSYRTLPPEGVQAYGLEVKANPTEAEAKAVFDKGGYLIAVGSGEPPFSGGGHYVYFYDYSGGKFYCGNSVLSKNGKGYTWSFLKSQSNVAMWAVWGEGLIGGWPAGTFTLPSNVNEADDLPAGVGTDGVPADLIAAMKRFGITDKLEKAHFLAQCAHESGNFKWKTEFASGAAYEGRSDLGNTQKGDGVRFKGRGYIQITGRANYTAINKWMKDNGYTDDVVAKPELLATKYPALSAVWFWTQQKGVKQFPTKAKEGATSAVVEKISRWVNGGDNGLEDRKKKFSFYWGKLKGTNPDPYV